MVFYLSVVWFILFCSFKPHVYKYQRLIIHALQMYQMYSQYLNLHKIKNNFKNCAIKFLAWQFNHGWCALIIPSTRRFRFNRKRIGSGGRSSQSTDPNQQDRKMFSKLAPTLQTKVISCIASLSRRLRMYPRKTRTARESLGCYNSAFEQSPCSILSNMVILVLIFMSYPMRCLATFNWCHSRLRWTGTSFGQQHQRLNHGLISPAIVQEYKNNFSSS